MSNPDDDTDVTSGLNDDAEMERTSLPPSEIVDLVGPLSATQQALVSQ